MSILEVLLVGTVAGPGSVVLSRVSFNEGIPILGWVFGLVAGLFFLFVGLLAAWVVGYHSNSGVRRVLARLLMGRQSRAVERLLGVVVSRHCPDLLGHPDHELRLADESLRAWSWVGDERPVSAEMRSEIARLFEARLGWRGRLLMRVKARHRVVLPESHHASLQTWSRLNIGRKAPELGVVPPFV